YNAFNLTQAAFQSVALAAAAAAAAAAARLGESVERSMAVVSPPRVPPRRSDAARPAATCTHATQHTPSATQCSRLVLPYSCAGHVPSALARGEAKRQAIAPNVAPCCL